MRKHLFSTLEEIIQYFPFQRTAGFYEILLPTIKMVEKEFVQSDIDSDTWSQLLVEIEAGTWRNDAWEDLADKARTATASLVALHGLGKSNLIYSPSGLLVSKTTNTVPASEYRTEQLKAQLYKDIQLSLDHMISCLEENTAIFLDWVDSNEQLKLRELILPTAAEFSLFYNISENRYLFRKLIAVQKNVISTFVSAAIGADYLAEVIEYIHSEPSPEMEKFIPDIKTAVACLTFAKALPRIQAMFGPDGLAIFDDPSRTKPQRRADNDLERIRFIQDDAIETGKRHLAIARYFLSENASEAVYSTFFKSEAYTDPLVDNTDMNTLDENQDEGDFDHFAL
jgi:hypothetical protein